MRILLIIWTFIKKYWELFLLLVGVFAGIFLLRQQKTSFIDDIKKIQDAHDEEVKRINAARDEERRQRLENERRLNNTLQIVQAQYDAARKELDDKKKKEVEQLVKDFGDKPEELAKKLSEVTGFIVILPS
jgi:flagellar motility protein MotE (MotC chaperone)